MIYFALGNGYLMLDNFSRAESAYRQALQGNPGYAACWMNLAVTCYRQEKYGEAGRCFVKSYETAAEKKPERLFYGAAAYLSVGEYKRALAGFERLLAAHPAQIEPAWKETLVHAFLAVDQPKRALLYIQELVQEHEGEDKIRWQEILLQQYLSLDMAQEALKLAEELTREHPLAPRWWKALAHVHLTASRYEEALVALAIYSWLTVPTEEEQRLLADLYLHLGIPVKAAPMYEEMLRCGPDDRLLHHLVMAYRRLGRPEEALEHLEKFGQHGSDPSLLMLRGDLLYELGRYGDAADSYRQAARTDAQQAGRAWLMAGYAAWQMNDLTGSRSAFERAKGFSDQKTAALAAIRRLAQFRQ
jgi:tetratricopeptide (TPR) repeat protein